MKLVYLDETGISNPKHETHVVVCGAIIDADKKLIAVERHLEALVAQYIPKHQQDGFIFHAKHLFNGGGPVFKRHDPQWPLAKRWEIAGRLADIPRKFKLPLVVGFAERSRYPTTLDAHVTAYVSAAMQTEMWMRQNASGEVCLMIMEDNAEVRRHIRDMQNIYRDKAAFSKFYEDGKIPADIAEFFPFRKIKQSPLFEEKSHSRALQVADFCAYVFKKNLALDMKYKDLVAAISDQYAAHSVERLSSRKKSA